MLFLDGVSAFPDKVSNATPASGSDAKYAIRVSVCLSVCHLAYLKITCPGFRQAAASRFLNRLATKISCLDAIRIDGGTSVHAIVLRFVVERIIQMAV